MAPASARLKGPKNFINRIRPLGKSPFRRAPSTAAVPQKAASLCTNEACTNPNIIEDDGRQVCTTCGAVAREQNIVAEVQFGETSSGAAAIQGSYVGEGRTHAATSGGPGHSRDGLTSRELSALNARREIDALILNLRVPSNLADPAVNIFKLSLAHAIYDDDGNAEKDTKNFVQGRSIRLVAAVALYIACRRQKSTNTVMLIDIAETMTPQVNVFKMGNIYNRMVRSIWGLPDGSMSTAGYVDPINPENLIRRFAGDLEFGPLLGKVTDDAIRLLQRMDRDWMTTGRRPAGLCGAALILAARMNNFRRTVREVVLVVKVCEVTVNHRLEEFQNTNTSSLTIQQLRQGEHTTPADPPAFAKAQGKGKKPKSGKKRKRTTDEAETAAEIEGDETEEERPRRPKRLDKDGFAIPDIPIPIDPALQQQSPSSSSHAMADPSSSTAQSDDSSSNTELPKRRGRPKGAKNRNAPKATVAETALEEEIERDILTSMNSQAMQNATPDPSSSGLTSRVRGTLESDEDEEAVGIQPEPIEPQTELTGDQTEPDSQHGREVRMDPEILEDEFDDDPEVANAVLSEAEIRIKEHIWVEENKQWLRNEHAKKIKKELQDAADIAAGITPGQNNKKKRRRGRRIGDVSYLNDQQTDNPGDEGDEDQDPAAKSRRSASLAMKGMLEQRGYSRRLNYDALSKMFPDDMAAVGKKDVHSRRSKRQKTNPPAPQTNVATTPDPTPTEQPAPETVPRPSPRRSPGTTPPQVPVAQQAPLPTPSPTQAVQAPQAAPAPIPPPIVEGEEELVGSIDSESPLSAIGAGYHGSLIPTAHGGGFAGDGDDQDEGEEDEDDGEEEDEDEDDDEGDYDGVEDALHGRYHGNYENDGNE